MRTDSWLKKYKMKCTLEAQEEVEATTPTWAIQDNPNHIIKPPKLKDSSTLLAATLVVVEEELREIIILRTPWTLKQSSELLAEDTLAAIDLPLQTTSEECPLNLSRRTPMLSLKPPSWLVWKVAMRTWEGS